MTRQQAEAAGYVVATREIDVVGNPPRVTVVTLRRGTTNASWAAVEQTLSGPGLGGLNAALDALVERINEPIPVEPEPEPAVDRVAALEAAVAALTLRVEALEGSP